jgi:cytochrome P450
VNFCFAAPPEPPYFDCRRNSWILSRYGDVTAALLEPRLVPAKPHSTDAAVAIDSAAHSRFRAEALGVLAPAKLRQWEIRFRAAADEMAGRLAVDRPADLVAEYARPWSLALAALAAGVPREEQARLAALAGRIFEAACEPYDEDLAAGSSEAARELAVFFQGAAPLNMQMFIALAHSLPAFLGNAWATLVEHPVEMARLRQEPALLPKAIDELLRVAGPARAQFRQAVEEVRMEECTIGPRQRVILMLDRANCDPEHFPDPDKVELDGRTGDHLAFGAGLHACVAGTLVRSAAAVATRALTERFRLPEHYTAVPASGFAMRYLKSLVVALEPGPK